MTVPRPTTLSRRRLLAAAGLAALASACGDPVTPPPEGSELSADSLAMLNWSDYVDPDEDGAVGTISRFRQATGIPVQYDPDYVGNFEILADLFAPRLGNGEPIGYDIAVPTYWLAQRMLANGWLEEIPLELIPNRVNLDPVYMGLEWDRGARFHLPWQVGLTGITHDPVATERLLGRPLVAVEDLFDPALRGRVSFIGEMREAVGLVMLAAGQDPSQADPVEANTALDRIAAAASDGQIAAFTFEDFADGLVDGRYVASMAWSGDSLLLIDEQPQLEFLVPAEGGIRWFDTMVIPQGATNPGAAAAFMDFVYDPVQAAQITAWVGYISPVLGVEQALADAGLGELAENPLLFPDDATNRRLRTWGGIALDVEDDLDARFAEIAGL